MRGAAEWVPTLGRVRGGQLALTGMVGTDMTTGETSRVAVCTRRAIRHPDFRSRKTKTRGWHFRPREGHHPWGLMRAGLPGQWEAQGTRGSITIFITTTSHTRIDHLEQGNRPPHRDLASTVVAGERGSTRHRRRITTTTLTTASTTSSSSSNNRNSNSGSNSSNSNNSNSNSNRKHLNSSRNIPFKTGWPSCRKYCPGCRCPTVPPVTTLTANLHPLLVAVVDRDMGNRRGKAPRECRPVLALGGGTQRHNE